MKQRILNNIKNIYGWKTKRKIVVFSVDDYGNVRLASKKARENLDLAGLKVYSRFDAFDTLETKQDLEALFETLTSVKDKNNRNAVMTPFALPCNIDFEGMAADHYKKYLYEVLPTTFEKLATKDSAAYAGTWNLWKEGIDNGIFVPQFHGREHFNLKVFNEKLRSKDKKLLTALKNRSLTSIVDSGYRTINTMAAFDFWNLEENKIFEEVILDGLNKFEEVYGYKSIHFNPPGGREHPSIHKFLKSGGIKYLDTPLLKSEHLGFGKYKTIFNYTGKRNNYDMYYQVRNVVFEPTEKRGIDWVNYAMSQIKSAFFWNRPAIISSHRVNFCGYIDEKNRQNGISDLRSLLKNIVQKWPDVEFMSSVELGNLMSNVKEHV